MYSHYDMYFEIVVLLFRNGEIRRISKRVPSLYKDIYRETAYKMAEKLLLEGWKVSCIYIDNVEIVFPKVSSS